MGERGSSGYNEGFKSSLNPYRPYTHHVPRSGVPVKYTSQVSSPSSSWNDYWWNRDDNNDYSLNYNYNTRVNSNEFNRQSYNGTGALSRSNHPIKWEKILGNSSDVCRIYLSRLSWYYASVFLGQPFEVARLILQVHVNSLDEKSICKKSRNSQWRNIRKRCTKYDDEDNDYSSESDDVASYFTQNSFNQYDTDNSSSLEKYTRHKWKNRRYLSDSDNIINQDSDDEINKFQYVDNLPVRQNESLFQVVAAVWKIEGVWGVWKATNATFTYNIAWKTLYAAIYTLIETIFNINDVEVDDVNALDGLRKARDSVLETKLLCGESNVWVNIAMGFTAAGLTSIALSPLDLIRCGLIVTSISSQRRNVLHWMMTMPCVYVRELFPIIVMYAGFPRLVSCLSTTWLLRHVRRTHVTPATALNLTDLFMRLMELFLRLPLETVLRRAQVNLLYRWKFIKQQDKLVKRESGKQDSNVASCARLIIRPGEYHGIMGTMWHIMRNEACGYERSKDETSKLRVSGLFQGWKMGIWGVLGMWSFERVSQLVKSEMITI